MVGNDEELPGPLACVFSCDERCVVEKPEPNEAGVMLGGEIEGAEGRAELGEFFGQFFEMAQYEGAACFGDDILRVNEGAEGESRKGSKVIAGAVVAGLAI